MQRLKNKLNLTASIAMTYTVIKQKEGKKNLLRNGTWFGYTTNKYTTTSVNTDDTKMLPFMRI
jgi:hypothetical protein